MVLGDAGVVYLGVGTAGVELELDDDLFELNEEISTNNPITASPTRQREFSAAC